MNKEKQKNLFGHPLIITIFTALCLLTIISLRESSQSALVSKKSLEQLEEKVKVAEKELTQVKKEFEQGQDPLALEKIQRNELLQKKEGEIILQIPDLEETEVKEGETQPEETGPLEEWYKLLWKSSK